MGHGRTKVFVSYSRHDEALVKPLAALLGVAAEDSVFLDVERLKPGDEWEKEIVSAIQECSVFVLCWCCGSRQSDFVSKEIEIALRDRKRRLVPVLFCRSALPASLSSRFWIDLCGRVVHACVESHPPQATVDSQKSKHADLAGRDGAFDHLSMPEMATQDIMGILLDKPDKPPILSPEEEERRETNRLTIAVFSYFLDLRMQVDSYTDLLRIAAGPNREVMMKSSGIWEVRTNVGPPDYVGTITLSSDDILEMNGKDRRQRLKYLRARFGQVLTG